MVVRNIETDKKRLILFIELLYIFSDPLDLIFSQFVVLVIYRVIRNHLYIQNKLTQSTFLTSDLQFM